MKKEITRGTVKKKTRKIRNCRAFHVTVLAVENSNEHLPIWNGLCTCTERRSFDRPNPSLRPDRLVLHNLQIRYCYRDCENGGLNEIQEKDRN